MPRRLGPVFVLSAACSAASFAVIAQEPTENWKRKHAVGDRVEGFGFERDVASAALSLVGFHAFREPVDLTVDQRLTVEFYAWQSRHARIVAREMLPAHNYWMEDRAGAKAGRNQWSNWTTAILRKAKPPIDPSNIGIVVRLGADRSDTDAPDGQVAPAILRRDRSAPAPKVSEYSATFLSDANLKDLVFSVFEGCDPPPTAKPLDAASFAEQYENTPRTITFHAGRPGLTSFHVQYSTTAKQPALMYCFWHVGDTQASGSVSPPLRIVR